MKQIEDYIQLSKEERQQHLRLDTPCIERGGNSLTSRGLLAHFLDTSIPKGSKIQLCHACHNGKCSNPEHLYWGTSSENRLDHIANGGHKDPYDAIRRKYGEEEVKRRRRQAAEHMRM